MPLSLFRLNLLVVLLVGFCGAACAGDFPAPPPNSSPGYENGKWDVEAWGNPGTAEWLADRNLLKLGYSGGEKEKTAFKRTEKIDLSQNGGLALYVYAPGDQPPAVSLAVLATDAFTWHESRPVSLKKGWNALAFSTSAAEWKTEAAKWAFSTAVNNRNDVRAICLLAYNGKTSGELFIAALKTELDLAASSGTAKKPPDVSPLKLPVSVAKLEAGAGWQASLSALEQHAGSVPQHWQIVGPLPDQNFKNFDVKDGLAPDRSDDWSALNVKRWSRAEDETGPKVDLEEIYGQRNDVLVYAKTAVDSPVDGPAWLWFDCAGKAVVYVNNAPVHRVHTRQRVGDAAADPLYPIPVQLKRGLNTVKVKIGQERNPPLRALHFSVRVQRNDAAYREELGSELARLYPREAADGKMAAWHAETARQYERIGDNETARKLYERVVRDFNIPGDDAVLEAQAALKRIAGGNPKKEDVWKIWKNEEDAFKTHLKNGEVERADAAMRGFLLRFPFHQQAGAALFYRGSLRLDYGAYAQAQAFYERALREGGDDEGLRLRTLRALSQAEFARTEQTDVAVNHDVQARLDGYRRALQGGNAEDVESALKHLADILANQAGALLRVGDSARFPRYAGVREYVRALLETLPPDALRAYRKAADPRANERVARAIELDSLAELEAAAAEYPYTAAAARALNRLGNACMDRGEYALAVLKFRQILEMPALEAAGAADKSALPSPTAVRLKLAHALLLSGQEQAARQELQRAEGSGETVLAGGKTLSAADAVRRLRERPALHGDAESVPLEYMGTLSRAGYAPQPGGNAAQAGALLWQANTPKSHSTNRAREYWPEDRLYTHVASFPVVENGRVYLTTLESAQAFELSSGKELWIKSWNSTGSLLQDRFTGYPVNCPAVRGGRLYFRAQQDARTSLRCLNAADGSVIWSTQGFNEFNAAVWLSDPLVVQGLAVAVCAFPAAQDGDSGASSLLTTHSLVAFDADSGQLRWRCALGTGLSGIRVRDRKGAMIYRTSFHLGPPAFQDGIVYTQTGLGCLAAVHAFTGEIVWMSAYPALRISSADDGNSQGGGFLPRMLKLISRGPSSPLISGDTIVLAPKDATGILAFDRRNGALRWSQPMCDARFLAGIAHGRVIAADTTVQAYNLETGTPEWTFLPPGNRYELYGHPAISGNTLYLPTSEALHVLDASGGAVRQTQAWDVKAGAFSNLTPLPGQLLGLNGRVFGSIKIGK